MAKLRFNAWMIHRGPESLASFKANAKRMARVYPAWYVTGRAGTAYRRAEATDALRQETLAIAKDAGVEVWPLISNFDYQEGYFEPGRMRLLFYSKAARQMHLEQLISLVKADGAQGLDLDYEAMYDNDKDALSEFVEEAARLCGQAGLKLGMAVHAKTAEPGGEGGSRSQDYARLGRALDGFQMMIYDYHWATGDAGPIAPPEWGAQVVKHALSLVPANKIEYGVPGYGNDWLGRSAQGVSYERWCQLKAAHGPEIRDPATAELTLRYDGREVWYNDAIAISRKLKVAQEAGIEQAAMWVLGSEDPRLWALLGDLPDTFGGSH